MTVKIIGIIILAAIISFVAYEAYSVNNPQIDPEKSKKIQELVSLQLENCIRENHSIELCDASLEEFAELARLELGKEQQSNIIPTVIQEILRNMGFEIES
ncbi:hypothetical protein C6990_09805 [Nitrosopumilus sp. b3]|uniref:hypothetical protein n=1 Tax=Nitrosopumilus sp. b3 TaxID=2109909 RepID=UPI0015F5D49E|nr:hypothetical protein [Nitrosopumilus sp. b3]KAF6246405.1 hypothetical protein C6990_09805 [Nitrosopumilus sp. b3]